MPDSPKRVRAMTDANVLLSGTVFPRLPREVETTAELRKHVKVVVSGTFLRKAMGWESEQLEAIRHRTWSDLGETDQGW